MKIINIASSDNFEDILEAVREAKSNELILVVPKSNRLFKNKNKTERLKIEFAKMGKIVSIIPPGQKGKAKIAKTLEDKLEDKKENKDKALFSFYSAEKPFNKMETAAMNEAPVPPSGPPAKKFILVLLGSAFALFVFIVFASLGKAEIVLVPKKSDFSVNIPVAVSDKVTEIDEVYGIIPGEWIEVEKVISKTFSSGSEKEVFQKGRGTITVYNNFSVLPQVLVATTRFQTPEGLVFRVQNAITVPGMAKVSGELKPGEIKAGVAADRAGDEYNIEPSDFRIPGFLGSPKYQGFYAKSFEKFSGGFVGRSAFVSRSDLEKAEETAQREAGEEIKMGLASIGDFKILDGAVRIEIEKMSESAKANDLNKEFKVVLKAKASAMVFKEEDAAELVSQYVKNFQDIVALKKGLGMDYVGPELDEEKKELSFKLVSSGQSIQNIDKSGIISEIVGKSKSQAASYLSGLEEIESARILSSFWLRKIPKNKGRINVKVLAE